MTAKIISFATDKGGSGKSVLSFNFGCYLARLGKRVLFIDLDAQEDMTSNFALLHNDRIAKEHSIYRAFLHDAKQPQNNFPSNFRPAKVSKHINVFSSSADLYSVNQMMGPMRKIAPYVVFHVIHNLKLRDKYDYIILDTHNNFQTLTENALIVSDFILSPVIPSRYGIKSMVSMIGKMRQLKKQFYNITTQKSDITAKLYFIGNMVKFNTRASQDFMNSISQNNSFIAVFHDRELFNRATTNLKSVYGLVDKENGNRRDYDEKIIKNEITPNFKKMNVVVSK